MAKDKSVVPAGSKELEVAKAKGQVVGFAQGVGATLLVGVVLRFLGWIPFLLVGGAVAYVGYKLIFGRKKKGTDEGPDEI